MAFMLLFDALSVLQTCCFGQLVDAPDISSINPRVVVDVVNSATNRNSLEFYCDIIPPMSTNYFYVVEWSLHTGFVLANSLRVHSPQQHMSREDFRRKTSLLEDDLIQHGITHPGFTLGCSVKAQTDLTGDFSHSRISPPKYFGLEAVNVTDATVRLTDGEQVTIYFKLTIPFGCRTAICFLDFNIYNPRNADHCTISHVAHNDRTITPCGIRFIRDDVEEGRLRPFHITTSFGKSQISTRSMVYDVELVTASVMHNHPFFEDYLAASIRVELGMSRNLLDNRVCYLEEDFNMITFDGRHYVMQSHGIYILYRHIELQVEVQIKSDILSFLNNPSKPFNCGVVVRAGRDLFMIDHCQQFSSQAMVTVCKDGVLNRKIRKIDNMYKIYLPSGNVVDVTENGRIINVAIHPSLTDLNKTEGLCGSFDLNMVNDIAPRPGSSSKSSTDSWIATSNENLFNRHNYANLTGWYEDRYLCNCEKDYTLANGQLTPVSVCDTVRRIHCPDDRTSPTTHMRPTCDLYV